MTTTNDTKATRAPARALGGTEPRARFRDLVTAEWIKLRSLRSTWIAYAATALAVIALNVGTAYDTSSHWAEQNQEEADFIRNGIPLQDAFTVNASMIMMLALGALGAVMILVEYGTGMIRTTFAAVPARRSVLAAKAVVLTMTATAFGAFVASTSFVLTQAVLNGKGVGVPISHPGALRLVLASALLAPVSALVGLALGTVLRHTAATMTASVLLLFMLPIALSDDRHWQATLGHATPYRAWLKLAETGHTPSPFPWTTTGAWTVYALWAIAAAALAITSVHRRDQLSRRHHPQSPRQLPGPRIPGRPDSRSTRRTDRLASSERPRVASRAGTVAAASRS
ncbi:ABC transporter permease [Actinocorallia populi]|uniref:ABC transporter permease n=1 Tax=Actinocorallia populi TaxID=2079200 RepID=UPI000D09308C|nr:ABC transporter permease [Actinocorallia populi]